MLFRSPRPPSPAPRPAPPAPRDALRLITDYLPPFVYVDVRSGKAERLAYSFRVARHPGLDSAPEFRIWWRLLDKDGKELAKGDEKGLARERFAIVRGFLELPEGARRLEYGLESGDLALGAGRAEVVREDDAWPAGAYAALSGLVGPGGERLILCLPERVSQVDERWKPLKFLAGNGRPTPESVVVVGPRMAPDGARSYLDLLGGQGGAKADGKLKPLDLFAAPPAGGDAPARPAPPTRGIFALVEAVESRVSAEAKGADLVVLVMPQSDPEMGTDRRSYRQGLDWVISRLTHAGAKGVAVVPPLSHSVSGKQLAAYADICAESAKVYAQSGAVLVKSDGLLAEEYWKPEGATGRVTGRFPNEAGQEALARLVRDACK